MHQSKHCPHPTHFHVGKTMCKPKIALCKPKPAMKQVYIEIFEPTNLSDLGIFFKTLLSPCTLVCDEYVPHITGLIREVPILGVKSGLHG
jgi:hypothetical protein